MADTHPDPTGTPGKHGLAVGVPVVDLTGTTRDLLDQAQAALIAARAAEQEAARLRRQAAYLEHLADLLWGPA